MRIKLSKEMYKLLLKVDSIEECISEAEETDNDVVYVELSDVRKVQGLISFDIVDYGMDNQDTVNEYGIQLYNLYDEIYDQVP
jgi:hypothetical protein